MFEQNIKIDAEFQKLNPPLSTEEYSQLEANILADGVRDALVIWDGTLLDGHNRFEICKKHGIVYSVTDMVLKNRDDAFEWIYKNQLGRRNLTADQRNLLIGELYNSMKKQQGAPFGNSNAEKQSGKNYHFVKTAEVIAKEYNVSEKTVRNAGKLAEQAKKNPKIKEAINNKKSIKNIIKEDKKQEVKENIALLSANVADKSERYQLFNLRCLEALNLEPDSVDWVITDPPYPKEFLDIYNVLGQISEHVLKPGGLLIAMVGQSYLPEIISNLSKHLTYHWTMAYLTPGGKAVQQFQRNVNIFWKPVLIFSKEKYTGKWFGDVCKSNTNDNDKEHHHWGQSESGMKDLMNRFVMPGDVVLDPFLGGGTTAVVALDLGCHLIGYDIAKNAIDATKARICQL